MEYATRKKKAVDQLYKWYDEGKPWEFIVWQIDITYQIGEKTLKSMIDKREKAIEAMQEFQKNTKEETQQK